MKKNVFSVMCLLVMLLCMTVMLFGCTEPYSVDMQQSENADIDISVSDFETMQSENGITDVNVAVLDEETQEINTAAVDITVSDDDIKLNQPVVEVNVSTPYYYSNQQEREERCGMSMEISVDPKNKKLDECVLQVLYDPDVLQYKSISLCPSPDVDTLIDEVILTQPGKALIKVSGNTWYSMTKPICFHVLSDEEIDLDISLVSYTDESGVRENAQLVVDMPVKVPVVKDLSAD